MTQASRRDIETLTPAWRELAHRAPVKLSTIQSERHHRAMIDFMNTLIDRIGDRENHPLIGLLDIVTIFVRDYEAHNIKLPDAAPASVLRLLMEQHDMRQTDLAKIDYDPDSRFNAFDLVGIKQYLEHELGVAVDVTTRDGLHPMLRADIEQSALRVF